MQTSKFICAGMIAAFVAASGGTLAGQFLWLGIFLFFTTLMTLLIGVSRPRYWRLAFIVNLCAVAGCMVPATITQSLQRYCYVLGAVFVIALFRFIIFQRSSRSTINKTLATTLKAGAKLSQIIFDFYLSRDFQANHFNHEKEWHSARSKFLKYLQRTRVLVSHYHGKLKPQYKIVLDEIEQLHEIFMAMGLLIDRVEDHTTFEVATKEFTRLSSSVNAYLLAFVAQLSKKKYSYPEDFYEAVSELQEINSDALQVVAREPVVFMLFVQDFFALNDILTQLGDAVADVT